jgi:hypothetical protein
MKRQIRVKAASLSGYDASKPSANLNGVEKETTEREGQRKIYLEGRSATRRTVAHLKAKEKSMMEAQAETGD